MNKYLTVALLLLFKNTHLRLLWIDTYYCFSPPNHCLGDHITYHRILNDGYMCIKILCEITASILRDSSPYEKVMIKPFHLSMKLPLSHLKATKEFTSCQLTQFLRAIFILCVMRVVW